MIRFLVATLLIGCGRLHFDPIGEAVPDGSGGGGDGSDPGSCSIGGGGCPQSVSTVGAGASNRSGNTPQGAGAFQGSCGGSGAGEATAQIIAMVAGTYTFSTAGSAIPAVMYIRSDGCNGAELACVTTSSTSLVLAQDERVVVFVDGAAPGVCGDYQLVISRM